MKGHVKSRQNLGNNEHNEHNRENNELVVQHYTSQYGFEISQNSVKGMFCRPNN